MTQFERLSRRDALRAAGLGTVTGLAGCLDALDSGSDPGGGPDPVDLSGGAFDYQGGMEIGRHGGPNGQVFYSDNRPETPHDPGTHPEAREDLAWFHTLVFGLFPYHFERLDRGWDPAAVYVTDYSAVDWQLIARGDTASMPSPMAADTFGDATELTYVVESSVRGGMGPALIPFSDSDEAESFAAENGGRTVGYDAITRQMVDSLRRR